MRKIPVPKDIIENGEGWIGLPDEWLGKHAVIRDDAIEKALKEKLPPVFVNFAVAMSLLEDWGGLPGLDGNPDKWELGEVSWNLIAFITGYVSGDLDRAGVVSKNYYAPLPIG